MVAARQGLFILNSLSCRGARLRLHPSNTDLHRKFTIQVCVVRLWTDCVGELDDRCMNDRWSRWWQHWSKMGSRRRWTGFPKSHYLYRYTRNSLRKQIILKNKKFTTNNIGEIWKKRKFFFAYHHYNSTIIASYKFGDVSRTFGISNKQQGQANLTLCEMELYSFIDTFTK